MDSNLMEMIEYELIMDEKEKENLSNFKEICYSLINY